MGRATKIQVLRAARPFRTRKFTWFRALQPITTEKEKQFFLQPRELAAMPDVPLPNKRWLRLAIYVHRGALKEFSWDGLPLNDLVSPAINRKLQADDYNGFFGIFVDNTDLRLQNVQIKVE